MNSPQVSTTRSQSEGSDADREQPLAQNEEAPSRFSPTQEDSENHRSDVEDNQTTRISESDVSNTRRTDSVATDTASSSTTPVRSTTSSPTSRSGASDLVCEAETESTAIDIDSNSEVRRRSDSVRGGQRRSLNRPMSFRLMSQHGPILQEDMTMDGSPVSVRLGEEGIEWCFKKSGKKRELKFDEIFAVNPVLQKSKHSHQSASSSEFLKTLKRKQEQQMDDVIVPKPMGFSLYSLHPHKAGHVMSSEFMCCSSEMGSTWLESIKTMMHECNPRPRKLYVVINPLSGKGNALKVWEKIERLFQVAEVELTVVVTNRKGHGRELTQYLDCSEYDGIVGVGGDGLYSELLNGLLVQAQFSAGVNLRRARFIPVQPNICLGMIPTGLTNTLSHSLLNQPHPVTAAVQVILGRSVQLDVCSVYANGQLIAFSCCTMTYSISNIELLPKPEEVGMSWLDEKISSLGRKLSKK
jgi:ceramide kinase